MLRPRRTPHCCFEIAIGTNFVGSPRAIYLTRKVPVINGWYLQT